MRFLRFRSFLLFFPLLFVLLLVGQGAPGLVQAQEMDLSDFACWATGDFPVGNFNDPDLSRDPNWGDEGDEFVVDLRDLGNDVLLLTELKAEYLVGHDPLDLDDDDSSEEEVYTLFDSMPELVDYTFGLDYSQSGVLSLRYDRELYDRRVRRLMAQFAGRPYDMSAGMFDRHPDEDQRFLLPWGGSDGKDKYMDRRRVAVPYKDAVQSFNGQWLDPANPEGGRALDFVALARDQAANRLEALEGTVSAAGDGGVVHYGTIEAVAQQFTFTSNNTCSGPACSGVTQVFSELVPVTFHTSVREQNDGQTYRNVTEAGDRVVRMFDVGVEAEIKTYIENNPGVEVDPNLLDRLHPKQELEFDLSYLPPSTLHLRDPVSGAYYRRYQENTGSDHLQISLVLQDRYRRDLNFDPDSGPLYGERGLPVMGFEPWSYDSINRRRDVSVNEWSRPSPEQGDTDKDAHWGYRQSLLHRVYSTELSELRVPSEPERIGWPVNLEDLNWYLYKLPSTGYRDPLWLYWVSSDGRRRVVNSAYGTDPVPFPRDGYLSPGQTKVPDCFLPGERDEDGALLNYAASGYRPPLNIEAIKCDNLDPLVWDWAKVWKGVQEGVNLPFDSHSGVPATPGSPRSEHLLSDDLLIKQGVESAADAGGPIGTRQLNRFDFLINESERMGNFPPGQRGYDAERRYGLPRNGLQRDAYVDNWAFKSVDPNMPHLLVVTFYEAKVDKDLVDFKIDDDVGALVFSVPKRRLQRVICRIFVHPSGNNPAGWLGGKVAAGLGWAGGKIGGVASGAVSKATGAVSSGFEGVISALVKGFSAAPLNVARQSTALVCGGVGELDRLSGLDRALVVSSVSFVGASTSPYSLWAANSLRDKDGDIRINAAQQSKLDGIEQCNEVSTPLISTCKRSSDVVFQGECMRLPELRLQVRDAEFIEPPGPPDNFLEYDEYSIRPLRDSWMNYGDRGVLQVASVTEEGVRPKFLPPANVDASPPAVLTARNVGLTRAFLGWEVRWDNVSSEIHDVIDGFMIFVYPDQKSSKVLVPEGGFGFHLPKLVQFEHNSDGDDDMRYSRVDGFSVGGLYHYPGDSRLAQDGSDSLAWESSADHNYTKQVPIGGQRVRDDYEGFNKLIHNMPLAPGFVHGFEVAPYVGKPFGSDFKLGPRSEKIILNGDHVACDEVPELPAPGHPHPPPPAVDAHPHPFDKIRKLYDCGESSTPGALGYADDGFRPGLLALTGTDICTDIFSSTPARFTWDNPAVHRVWGFVWIIAGSVLFTLLVWQGLRMTYDVWLDPQPSVGFRELVPRFLLAAALAASSLIICRMVLVAASDLTCFVAQSTHMTMWGVIHSTFGTLVGGFTSWYQGAVAEDVSFLQRFTNDVTLFIMGFLVLIVLFFILILFLKVLLSMLLRVALLAILIALSPLAFAFYASDATSHWTKKWVTLFLGTTFQQVIVLVVIYLGISIMDAYFGSGVKSGMVGMLVGMLMAFATLSLATTIPEIVNPGGKGIFSALGSMLTMAAAGAMMVASAGMGAVAGGAAAMGGGGGGAAGAAAAATGPSSPPAAGGGAAGAPAAGGGGGGAGPGLGGGDNLVSSVNRRSMGPAGGPSSGPSASPASSGAGPSASGSGGGVTLSSGSPDAPASSGGGPSGGGTSAGGRAGGILRGVGSGFMRGARRGQRFNTRMNDTMAGNAFYSHSSRSDDAAQQVRAQREEQSEDRVHTRESYDRLSEVLDRIDERL